jgi:hypothetical protein
MKKALLLVATFLICAVQGRADTFDFTLTNAQGNVIGFQLGLYNYIAPVLSNYGGPPVVPGDLDTIRFGAVPTTYNGQSAGVADIDFSLDAANHSGGLSFAEDSVAFSIYDVGHLGWNSSNSLLNGVGNTVSNFVPGAHTVTEGPDGTFVDLSGAVLTITRAPEPGTFALLSMGLIGIGVCLKVSFSSRAFAHAGRK